MKPRSSYRGLTLFITVGSTRFDRLICKVLNDDCATQLAELGFKRLILQVGKSEFSEEQVEQLREKFDFEIDLYDYKPSITEDIERADVVVGHAGAGTCLEVLRTNKRLLIVVNESLMDNHQSELADKLAEDNYVIQTGVDEFEKNLALICNNKTKLSRFPARDASLFENIFDETLDKVQKADSGGGDDSCADRNDGGTSNGRVRRMSSS